MSFPLNNKPLIAILRVIFKLLSTHQWLNILPSYVISSFISVFKYQNLS